MPFLWRRKRGGGEGRRGLTGKRESPKGTIDLHKEMITIPTHFRCPITLDLMKDPVSLSTGITYDRESIDKWINEGHVTCPVSNQVLRSFDQIPNHALRKMIQDWCVEHRSYGVERIPTPRIPITPHDVSVFCSRILASTRNGDERTCSEWLHKVKSLAKESERNEQCIVSNGIGSALASVLESFARTSVGDKCTNLIKEALSMLTWSFPLGEIGISKLKSEASLNSILHFLQGESNDLPTIQNAIFVLKDLAFEDQTTLETLNKIKGIETTLLRAMRLPVGPKATQACLMLIHLMISSHQENSPTTISRFIQLGLLTSVLDTLVDGNKSTCEKALFILDDICNTEEGKKAASANALTVPLVVKKILRVSDIATEYSITILWKLGGNEDAVIEAVQHGAFQKLLVVLQVGGGDGSKQKTTELLRLMNRYRNKLDCFESSMGLKYVKNSN